MLAESVILSIIIGVLRGKKIRNLENIKMNKSGLIIFAFALEFINGLILKNNIEPLSKFISENYLIIHIIIYIILFIFFAFNLSNNYLKLVFIGVFLNFIVIVANNGFMPVSLDMALANEFHQSIAMLNEGKVVGHTVLIPDETKLWYLSDIINIPPPYPFPQTISIGDIFISIGTFLFIQLGMNRRRYFSG